MKDPAPEPVDDGGTVREKAERVGKQLKALATAKIAIHERNDHFWKAMKEKKVALAGEFIHPEMVKTKGREKILENLRARLEEMERDGYPLERVEVEDIQFPPLSVKANARTKFFFRKRGRLLPLEEVKTIAWGMSDRQWYICAVPDEGKR